MKINIRCKTVLMIGIIVFYDQAAVASEIAVPPVVYSVSDTAAIRVIKTTTSARSTTVKEEATPATTPILKGILSDGTLKTGVPFPVGAAVKIKPLRNSAAYRNVLIKQFSSITAENAMKFGSLHPSENVYRWKDADEIVAFAIKHQLRVHGHTLLWPKSNPEWVKKFQGDSVAWEGLLKRHIQTVVKHFKGKVASWDVVNEAMGDDGRLKKNIWLQKLGPGYIARCFQYAHEADPNAILFYNDYGHEYSAKRRRAIISMVKDLRNKGVPIDGLGLQMHTKLRIVDKKIQDALKEVAATGLMIHISELEITVGHGLPTVFQLTDDLNQRQGQKYKMIFKAYSTIPARQQFGITTWGVGDQDSFRNAKLKNHEYPILFDPDYQPKAAVKAVLSIF
ncbi:endo-1,4-beta-xylanase [Pedobacter sp. AW31-3R]|uniref:endo-1,4-beta-xylanase n=1 Tax=Pedobacter sp. AW31-3R TaxID=3445781 RepID=UPI003FA03ECC